MLFPPWLCRADEGRDGGAGWTHSEDGATEYVSVSLKMQPAFTSTPHILHPGEMERELPGPIRRVQADDHSLLACTYGEVVFSPWRTPF